MKLNFLLFLKFQPLRNQMVQFSPLQGCSCIPRRRERQGLGPRHLAKPRQEVSGEPGVKWRTDVQIFPIMKQTKVLFLTGSILCFVPSIIFSFTDGTEIKIRNIIILGQNYGKIYVMGTSSVDCYKEMRHCVFVPFVWSALSALKQVQCAGISSLSYRMLAANLIKSESRCVKSS